MKNKIKRLSKIENLMLATEKAGAGEELSLMFESDGKFYRFGYSDESIPGTYLTENKSKEMKKTKVGHFSRLVFLNTSIVTSYGTFSYHPLSLDVVKEFIAAAKGRGTEILSAIGHESTAKVLSDLTGTVVPVNRIQYKQEFSDVAIVFKLNGRPPEGRVLSIAEMEEIGYQFGILCMEY